MVTKIIEDGNFAIFRTESVLGGEYSVVNLTNNKAKIGLCLDAAYEIFNKLTKN
jgi:hypothetical protein